MTRLLTRIRYWYNTRKVKSQLDYKFFLETELTKINVEFQKYNWVHRDTSAEVLVKESAVWRDQSNNDLPPAENFGEVGKV